MSDSLTHYDTFIFDEMMTHPLFFTHPCLRTVAVIAPNNAGILQELLKHPEITEIWQIGGEKPETDAAIVHYSAEEVSTWLQNVSVGKFDAIIVANPEALTPFNAASYKQFMAILPTDGIFIQPCDSLFHPEQVRNVYQIMQTASGDLQLFNFPQPSIPAGMRTAIMGVKSGVFKRIREKDIFNKNFTTRYYNYDTHKAALALPEFMRAELIS